MTFTVRIFHNQTMRQAELAALSKFTIGSRDCDCIIDGAGLLAEHALLYKKKDQWRIKAAGRVIFGKNTVTDQEIKDGDLFVLDKASRAYFVVYEKTEQDAVPYPLDGRKNVTVGRNSNNDVSIHNQRISGRHLKLTERDGTWTVEDLNSTNGLYVNGSLEKKKTLFPGDVISVERYDLVFDGNKLLLEGMGGDIRTGDGTADIAERRREYPYFKRSPRLKYETLSGEITIQAPPATGMKPEINWLTVILPPIAMMSISAAMVFVLKTNISMLLYSAPMTLIGLIVSLINYSFQKKKHKKHEIGRLEAYNDHLLAVSGELEETAKKQMKSLLLTHPESGKCMGIVSNIERRLWERTPQDSDFMTLRIGSGVVDNNMQIKTPHQSVTVEKDSLLAKTYAIAEKYKTLSGAPITLDLRRFCTAGIIGSRKSAVSLAKNMLVQAASHHCYTELKIITLFPQTESELWEFAKWLPHSFSNDRRVRFMADTRFGAVGVSKYFEDIVGQRIRESKDDNSQSVTNLPYLLFVIASQEYMEGIPFQRGFLENNPNLGIGAIFLFDEIGRLPKDCNAIIEVKNDKGILLHKDNVSVKTKFTIDSFSDDGYGKFARGMAPIRAVEASDELTLPASVTFLEGYGVKKPSEIDLTRNWLASAAYNSMSVPIGIRANGEPFQFDIHEKKHGPHGLVAGMTGSGKSEMVQSWILSMAVHHPPANVSFVLIDFKGTGLILPFANLPHLAGTISDLDTNISRNLLALENELSRRKALLDQFGVNNISGYMRLYAEGKADEPLSFLFIIIDEFAEFKVQFPDFMTVIDRIFAIGRTLGVFAILLTQKPAGVVGDKMTANTRFRWCLKVASSADSKEMLRHPDAVRITNPGRAYVQVGEDEIYELVQSYWSGAPYDPELAQRGVHREPELSVVDLGGKRTVFAENRAAAAPKSKRSEIDEIVGYVGYHTQASHIGAARKIWMPKLADTIYLPALCESMFDGEVWPKTENVLCPVVGMADDPRAQAQYPLKLNLSGDGHTAIYGSPSSGKTTLLQALVMSLILSYSPDDVNIYIMDFGGWRMAMFKDFPHVGGVANDNSAEEIEKTARFITKELDERKRKFAAESAGSIDSYRASCDEKLPYIVLVLDNFAPVLNLYPALEPFFISLTREGANYGIYFVTSANTTMTLGYRLGQNIKSGLALQMTDSSDYSSIVGKTEGLQPEKNAGRGLVRSYVPLEFQAALPMTGETERERVANIRAVCDMMNQKWQGSRAKPIPVMPAVVHFTKAASGHIAVGLSVRDVEPVEFDFDSQHYLLVSGRPASGKSNLLKVIAKQCMAKRTVFDLTESALRGLAEDDDTYITAAGEFDAFLASLVPILQERKNTYSADPDASFNPILIVIDNIKACFDAVTDDSAKRLDAILRLGKGLGVFLIAAGDSQEIAKLYSQGEAFTASLVNAPASILLGGSFRSHEVFKADLPYSEQEIFVGEYEGYIVRKEKALRFKAMYEK